jgi:septal ring factor EnvC (AmiA/AmiB activator)
MPVDYRSEIKRPVSLALAGAAILGWLLALGVGLSSSDQRQEAQTEITRLQQAEATLRQQLDEQQRTGGTLADLQARVAGAEQQLTQITQAREQAQAQLATLQQSLQTTQQQLAQVTQARE